jgi:hypothetical protein
MAWPKPPRPPPPSPTPSHRAQLLGPLLPLIRSFAPDRVTSTEEVGQAMIQAALVGAGGPVNHAKEMNALARGFAASRVSR